MPTTRIYQLDTVNVTDLDSTHLTVQEDSAGSSTTSLSLAVLAQYLFNNASVTDESNPFGNFSIAIGGNNTNSSSNGLAIGRHASATGDWGANAIGQFVTASATYSTACGYDSGASGYGCSVFGAYNNASGRKSTAIGFSNSASDYNTNAIGLQNTASGEYSIAIGNRSSASGYKSVAIGQNVAATDERSVAIGGSGFSGLVAGGEYSLAVGYDCQSLADNSTSLGNFNQATEQFTTSVGNGNNCSAVASTAIGCENTVSGEGSTASGYYNTVSCYQSCSFGAYNNVSGEEKNTAVGWSNNVADRHSTGIGFNNSTSGNYSNAFGYQNSSSGTYGSALGSKNTSSGYYSNAIGTNNQSTSFASIAVGNRNSSSGGYSSVFGSENTASGEYSVIAGFRCQVTGVYSTAVGIFNTASGYYSNSFGKTNASLSMRTQTCGGINASGFINWGDSSSYNIVGFNFPNSVLISDPDQQLFKAIDGYIFYEVSPVINISGNNGNNGTYVVSSVSQDSGTTSIEVIGNFITNTNTGQVMGGSQIVWNLDSPFTVISNDGTNLLVTGDFSSLQTFINAEIPTYLRSSEGNTEIYLVTSAVFDETNTTINVSGGFDETSGGVVVSGTRVVWQTDFNNNPITNNIIGVNTGSNTFTIAGNYTIYTNFGYVLVQDSTANNGIYTIENVNYDGTNTIIAVGQTMADNTADGIIQGGTQTNYYFLDSSAFGYGNTTSGYQTNAFGHSNTASGKYSQAFGSINTASGYSSIAVGINNSSSSFYGTAFGVDNRAFGQSAVALGNNCQSGYTNSVAIGKNCNAYGDYAIAIGVNNIASNQWATACGYNNTASGEYSSVFGSTCTASSYASMALGYRNIVNAPISTACGYVNTAVALSTHVFGGWNFTNSDSPAAVVFGLLNNSTDVTFDWTTGEIDSEPSSAETIGKASVAVGILNTASGPYGTAIGNVNTASGQWKSSALGANNTASGGASTACGYTNTASQGGTTAIGYRNTASGYYSSAVGFSNTASGNYSSSIGAIGVARIDKTTNIGGPIIIRRDNNDEFDEFTSYAGTETVIVSKDRDLTVIADYSIALPSGATFYPDECGIIIDIADGVTGQPTIRFGDEVPSDNPASLTNVQFQSTQASSTTSIGSVWPSSTTEGNLLIACIYTVFASVSSAPSGWSFQGTSAAGDVIINVYYITNANTRSSAETFTLSGTDSAAIIISEWTGFTTDIIADKASVNNGFGEIADSGTTAGTIENNELWLGFFVSSGSDNMTSPTDGFSILTQQQFNGNTAAITYLNAASSGSVNMQITVSSGEVNWAGMMLTFTAGHVPTYNDLVTETVTTSLTAPKKRQRFTTLNNNNGHTLLTAGVSDAAVATTMFGRFYWKGMLVEDFVAVLPSVSTVSFDQSFNQLTVHGNVTATGSSPVTDRGIVYGSNSTPTIDGDGDTAISVGSGLGTFSDMFIWEGGSNVYFAAYATNASGTSYGNYDFANVVPCFIEGTEINTPNNSKYIQDVTYDDNLLVWNFDEGKFDSEKPIWIAKPFTQEKYVSVTFSDGSTLGVLNKPAPGHRIFNIDKNMFTYLNTEDTPIGTHTFNSKGEIITLVSQEIISKKVNFYNIITNKHINVFANSILTSARFNNLYPIENMKFVKDNRELRSRAAFENVSDELFYGLRLAEQPESYENLRTKVLWMVKCQHHGG